MKVIVRLDLKRPNLSSSHRANSMASSLSSAMPRWKVVLLDCSPLPLKDNPLRLLGLIGSLSIFSFSLACTTSLIWSEMANMICGLSRVSTLDKKLLALRAVKS